MALTLHAESHTDHALTQGQIDWLLSQFAERDAFFIATVELPAELGTVPCGIHGPLMGDEPVSDDECRSEARGDRAWTSRLCDRPVRQVSQVSVIAGPHDGLACILYTAFGGPVSPQEAGDPGCKDVEASTAFWAEHALTA